MLLVEPADLLPESFMQIGAPLDDIIISSRAASLWRAPSERAAALSSERKCWRGGVSTGQWQMKN